MTASKPRRSPHSRVDLAFRPKSYWPRGQRGSPQDGIELVRITLATPTRDVFTLKARRADRHIVYQMVHQDWTGCTRHRIRLRPAASTRPLTLGELVAMLEGACFAGRCHEGDERFRGIIWGTL